MKESTTTNTNITLNDIIAAVNEAKELLKHAELLTPVQIFLINPYDLEIIKKSLDKIPNTHWFISDIKMHKGEMMMLKKELNKEFYEIFKNKQDRITKGLKE